MPTATMTVHPVRHSGMILGVPQTMRWFEQMQERITGFVAAHSGISAERYTELMLRTGELVMDVGTVLDGRKAVRESSSTAWAASRMRWGGCIGDRRKITSQSRFARQLLVGDKLSGRPCWSWSQKGHKRALFFVAKFLFPWYNKKESE